MPEEKVDIRTIVTEDNPELLVKTARKFVERYMKPDNREKQATKTQIRRLFSSLKNIDYSWPRRKDEDNYTENRDKAYRQLLLLEPRLSYEAGRHEALRGICNVVMKGIRCVDKDDRKTFERLVEFYEAVLGFYVGLKEA